jgi:hypothetical protein
MHAISPIRATVQIRASEREGSLGEVEDRGIHTLSVRPSPSSLLVMTAWARGSAHVTTWFQQVKTPEGGPVKHDNSSTYAAAVVLNGALFAKALGSPWLIGAALRSRRAIAKATDILLSRRSGSPEDAFAWLKLAANCAGVTLLQAAQAVIATRSET